MSGKEPRRRYSVTRDADGERLDRWLGRQLVDFSRSAVQKLIREGNVRVNDRVEKKCGATVHGGDAVEVVLPPPAPAAPRPEPIALDIIFEDDALIVLNKPAGMVVHPAAGNREGTLVNALLHHCKGLSAIGGVERPGIIHRLDKLTSGVLVVAKNDLAHRRLSEQLARRQMRRSYVAVVWGEPQPPEATIEAPIGRHPRDRKRMAVTPEGGRQAVTHYRTLLALEGLAVLEISLQTGRTHQIRVHLCHWGHPVVGDTQYGLRPRKVADRMSRLPPAVQQAVSGVTRQLLHAHRVRFVHPVSGQPVEFEAPLAEDIAQVVRAMESQARRRI